MSRWVVGVLICSTSISVTEFMLRRSASRVIITRVVNDGHLSIGLLDLQLGGCGRDAQEIIVGGIHDHFDYLYDVWSPDIKRRGGR